MNILFVCTGNTCRSSMAQYLMAEMLKKNSIEGINVASAGVAVFAPSSASENAIKAMKHEGINILSHFSRQIDEDIINDSDVILTMTKRHKQVLNQLFQNYSNKIFTLGEYVRLQKDIADPYGGSLATYFKCRDELKDMLELLITKLKTNNDEKSGSENSENNN